MQIHWYRRFFDNHHNRSVTVSAIFLIFNCFLVCSFIPPCFLPPRLFASPLYRVCVLLSVQVKRFLPVIQQIRTHNQLVSVCVSVSLPSVSPWGLDACVLIHHYEWGCTGCCGRGCFPLGPLPPPALWRSAEAAADGPVGDAAVLVPLLPHRLHPATWRQHGMKPLQLL